MTSVQLADWLVKLIGYDAAQVQPNSGAQGEGGGLSLSWCRNEGHAMSLGFDPASAHGTNPAAYGSNVVVVVVRDKMATSSDCLRAESEQAGDNLPLPVDFDLPPTAYEETIREVWSCISSASGLP